MMPELKEDLPGRHDPLGEDPSPEESRRASGHPPVKDQLHPIRASAIEVFTDDFRTKWTKPPSV